MSDTLRIGLVGFGKIARDEHLPAIAFTKGAELVAVAGPDPAPAELAHFPDLAAMLESRPDIDAVIMCQPPQVRYEAARMALLSGKHVFLEKPPGTTVSEVEALTRLADRQGVSLYTSWHSRYSSSVSHVREWCAARTLTKVEIDWKEDVRRWHPGQQWIWESGGFGVFDPGINALSILTAVLEDRVILIDARMQIPANRAVPIAANLTMETTGGVSISAAFDWLQTGPQIWQIAFEAGEERYVFAQGGTDKPNSGPVEESALTHEYRTMYRHFVELVRSGRSDVDVAPLQLVADAFLRGTCCLTEPFEEFG